MKRLILVSLILATVCYAQNSKKVGCSSGVCVIYGPTDRLMAVDFTMEVIPDNGTGKLIILFARSDSTNLQKWRDIYGVSNNTIVYEQTQELIPVDTWVKR